MTPIIDPSIFEDAIGKQFRIKKKNKDGSVSSLVIKVLKPPHGNIYTDVVSRYIEVVSGIDRDNTEKWKTYWLLIKDIQEAIPINK